MGIDDGLAKSAAIFPSGATGPIGAIHTPDFIGATTTTNSGTATSTSHKRPAFIFTIGTASGTATGTTTSTSKPFIFATIASVSQRQPAAST